MNVPLLDLTAQYRGLREQIRLALDSVLDEQQLILGKHVEGFEMKLAAACGSKHALGVSSGTDALLATLMALDIGPGDEVICPAFTFFATGGSIARTGAKPVFVDIEPATFNLDVTKLEAAITGRTRAIMPVHLFGQMSRMEAINAIAAKHSLHVIEDAAQAIGASRNGVNACTAGTAGCLSFYPTKNLGAIGDAGAIVTNDSSLHEKCRKVRVHGSGHTYFHETIGGMFRMAAVQAAALSVKIDHLATWNEGRRRNAKLYDELLAGSSVVTPVTDAGNVHTYHQYTVRIPDGRRDAVRQKLFDRGCGCGVFYPLGLHLQECFQYLSYRAGDLPETERASAEVLSLPIFPELSEAQITHVATTLRDVAG